MVKTVGGALASNFLGSAPAWYKAAILAFLVINPMGSFLGPFCTIDLCTVQNSCIGAYAYVQVFDLQPSIVDPGHIWIRNKSGDEFIYNYDPEVLHKYVSLVPGERTKGLFMGGT